MTAIHVSRKGLTKLKERLSDLEKRLQTLKKEKSVAYELSGDGWHDNPEYNRLLLEEEGVAKQIAELSRVIRMANIYDPSIHNTDQVALGSIVKISASITKRNGSIEETVKTWEIVGYEETDVENKKIAYNSPIAVAIMGLEEGESNKAQTPKGEPVTYEVKRLYKNWEETSKTK